MYRLIVFIILLSSLLFSEELEDLLKEYEVKTKNSLATVDERFGDAIVYSQKELRMMQYSKLSDLLRETSLNNLNKNRFGYSTLSLPGTKTDVSGFFRFFINDHEVSSIYTQSPSLSWIDIPLDFIDYVEIYRGNSSFTLGNETGVFFIRVYTKKPYKENGTEINTSIASYGSNSESITHSESFENGWSYLGYLNRSKTNESNSYNNSSLSNDTIRRYLFFDLNNEDTKINIAYTDLKKDNYTGLSLDGLPDDGRIERKDYYFDITKYFFDDQSFKLNFSVDVNNLEYEEKNSSGIAFIPGLDLTNLGSTIPKEYYSNIKLTKFNSLVSKEFEYLDNKLLFGLNFKHKKYDMKENRSVSFTNMERNYETYFNEESIFSFLFQNEYRVSNNFLLLLNTKLDKYKRNGILDDFSYTDFRIGTIYKPFENFGLKAFYTESTVAPSFYNIDFSDKNDSNLKEQKYDYYTIEGVYTNINSKISLLYNNVDIKNFIYYTPIGFINIDRAINTQGLTFDYIYDITPNNKIEFNYYRTWLSETVNSPSKGGYLKFMGENEFFSYFTSLIYRNGYKYYDTNVSNSFNLSLGATYKYSKNISISLKGENLLDDSSISLYEPGLSSNDFTLKDNQRIFTLSMKWML